MWVIIRWELQEVYDLEKDWRLCKILRLSVDPYFTIQSFMGVNFRHYTTRLIWSINEYSNINLQIYNRLRIHNKVDKAVQFTKLSSL